MPRRSLIPSSAAGTGGFMKPSKSVVKITIELPVMSATKSYEKALEIAKQIKEDEGVRVRGITVAA